MKIKSVRIQNFRSFKDQTVEFNDYNCLVGPNGSGKSTILNALNIFFRETKSSPVDLLALSKEDFHTSVTTEPIRITVTFSDLSDAAKDALKDYVRQDKLVVMAVAEWSEEKQAAPVFQKGLRLAMVEFAPFFKALNDGKPVADLKNIYAPLRQSFSELPAAATKPAMTEALRNYEDTHSDKCILIESDDEFYGVTKGAHKLGPFIQWIFIPAVKDATTEQIESKDSTLGRLIERTVRSRVQFADKIKALREKTSKDYDQILVESQSVLDDLSGSLKTKITKWAHPGADLAVRWDKDPAKSIRVEEPFARIFAGENGFLGELARLGHGFRRSFLLTILEELANTDAPEAPRLFLGIEEPELFQHPPQAQHLANVLQRLSEGNTQIFICTHSPYFVVGKGFEDIRLVRKPSGSLEGIISKTTFVEICAHLTTTLGENRYKPPTGVRAKIHQALQPALREMFFAPKLVFVEGLEDIAYIHSGLHLLGMLETWRATGAHVVPVHGKSELILPFTIAKFLKIPTFIIFDSDGDQTRADRKAAHQKDNERILKLLGQAGHDLFPAAISWQDNFVVWPTNLGDAVRADYVPTDWQKWREEVEAEMGQPGGLEKNALLIADVLTKAYDQGKGSATLKKLCESLLKFAQKQE